MKESKQILYTAYFESNWNKNKNTWKESKIWFQLKNITNIIPHSTVLNKRIITDPTVIIIVFNKYFTSIAENRTSNI